MEVDNFAVIGCILKEVDQFWVDSRLFEGDTSFTKLHHLGAYKLESDNNFWFRSLHPPPFIGDLYSEKAQ